MRPDRVKKVVAIGAGEDVPALRKFPLSSLEDFAQYDARFIKEKVALCPEPEKLQDFLNRYFTFFNRELISKELFGSIRCPGSADLWRTRRERATGYRCERVQNDP